MSLDIVTLIENNPITRFDGQYNSRIVEKVTRGFSNYEQQLFLSSFYCYLKYDYKNDFVINLDNIWSWLGFSQKYNAKYLLEKKFTINVDYKIIATEPSVAKNIAPELSGAKNPRGGQNKETIMLNVDTFKKMCMKAGTKKADEIHDYFIKLENVLQETLFEESNELKLQLEQQKSEEAKSADKTKREYELKLETQKVLEREKVLLREYATIGAMFYIMKVKTWKDNKQYVIKIGESRRGVADRYKEHKNKYEECILLDCFAVSKSRDFETFIKDHDMIRPNKYKTLEGHETELELFLVGKNLSYQTLLNIINTNIKYFNDNDTGKLAFEIEHLKLLLETKNNNSGSEAINELVRTVKQLNSKIDRLESVIEKLVSIQTVPIPKLVTGFQDPLKTLGPRVQKINPETLDLVQAYECVTEVMKEDGRIKRPSINKAVMDNTVYYGFRWALVDREMDPTIVSKNISPTKQTKVQNLGYIAQINKEQTEIVNIYIDRKTAAHFNGYESVSALDTPVKNFSLTNGFYYKIYANCDPLCKESFEKNHGTPLLYRNGVGQYDLENNLQKEFLCKYDCMKQLKISDKTLAKALDKDKQYNGFYYRTIGEKLKCL